MSVTMETTSGHLGVSSGGRSDGGPLTRVEAGEAPGAALLDPHQARALALELLERALGRSAELDELVVLALRASLVR